MKYYIDNKIIHSIKDNTLTTFCNIEAKTTIETEDVRLLFGREIDIKDLCEECYEDKLEVNIPSKKSKTQYVVGFAFNKELNKVLLILKNRPEWQKGLYNGIGGHIEKGETSAEAMSREFFEECGILIEKENWKEIGHMGGDSWDCSIFTTITDIDKYSNKTDEICTICNFKWDKICGYHIILPSNCIENLYWIIPLCLYSLKNDALIEVKYGFERNLVKNHCKKEEKDKCNKCKGIEEDKDNFCYPESPLYSEEDYNRDQGIN